jgi:Uma2 family endonuclease
MLRNINTGGRAVLWAYDTGVQHSKMAAPPDLITVAQYRLLPDDRAAVYETSSRRSGGFVSSETQALGPSETVGATLRTAIASVHCRNGICVPCHSRVRAARRRRRGDSRYSARDPDDNLRGAPELVIEVKSPSNTKRHLQDVASLCLANGSIQFWILDHVTKSVTVIQRDGSRQTYGIGETLSLAAFGSDSLSVAEIFDERNSPIVRL